MVVLTTENIDKEKILGFICADRTIYFVIDSPPMLSLHRIRSIFLFSKFQGLHIEMQFRSFFIQDYFSFLYKRK